MLKRLSQEWVLVRTIARLEDVEGALDDAEAFRAAANASEDMSERVRVRARELARKLGMVQHFEMWRVFIDLTFFAAVALALVVSTSVYLHGVATRQPVHPLVAAGLPSLLTLVGVLWWAWIMVPRGDRDDDGHAHIGLFGRLAQLIVFVQRRGQRFRNHMVAALREAAGENRAVPWLFSVINHGVWTLAMTFGLVFLAVGYMFLSVRFQYETTILGPTHFDMLSAIVGWGPALVGGPAAPPANLGMTLSGEEARACALWVCAVVFSSCLLPRLGLWLFSRWKFARVADELDRIPFERPYYAKLQERFAEWDRQARLEAATPLAPQVTDGRPKAAALQARRAGPALVAWSVPAEQPLPTAHQGGEWSWTLRAEGDHASREAVVDRVSRTRPASVAIVCEGADTPDLAIERLIVGIRTQGVPVALLRLGPDAADRWPRWLQARGLTDVPVRDLSLKPGARLAGSAA